MQLTPAIKQLLVFNAAYLALFSGVAIRAGNNEFLIYIAVVLFFVALLLRKHRTLGLSVGVLWALSIWGLLHMAGGNLIVAGDVLYNYEIFDALRYDKPVHAYGFGVATIVGWQLIRPHLSAGFNRTTLSVLLVMIGAGAGALNEVIEFFAVVTVPETNVGGYINTALDLVFNFIGAIIAVVWLRVSGNMTISGGSLEKSKE
jgi:putative membrane protein